MWQLQLKLCKRHNFLYEHIKKHTFWTPELIKNKKSTIMTALIQVTDAYHAWGFKIWHILGDRQFEHMHKHLEQMGIMLNITSRDNHVPEIERYIRTAMESLRATVNTLLLNQYLNMLIVETVYNTVFWLNCFPHNNGIHPTMSPHTIVTGSRIDYKNIAHYNSLHIYKYTNHTTNPFCLEQQVL